MTEDLTALRETLLTMLVEQVMPFWTEHALDRVHGGLYTYIASDGTVLDGEKSGTSNTRALYTFAALLRRIGERPEWREAADNVYDFLLRHGRDADGLWVFRYAEDGRTLVGENSIIVDAFAIAGLTQYYHVTGNAEALRLAVDSARLSLDRLSRPGTYKTFPYPTPPGMRPQREAMQYSWILSELGAAANDDAIREAGLQYGRDVLELFWRPELGVLLEYLSLDDEPVLDTPAGRCMVPGHAIETLLFQMQVFSQFAPGEEWRVEQAARALRPCIERGWDPEYGGLLLGIDVEGKSPVYWKLAQLKRWWPVTEALPACLLAYEAIGEQWCLDWFERIYDWSVPRMVDPVSGNWYQNLSRDGRPLRTAEDLAHDPEAALDTIDLRVKDPYHLPRGLMVCVNTLDRLISQRH